ncbi:MAG: ATP-binding cassette domain-containing protein, partial [Ignavibacteria bacterium]
MNAAEISGVSKKYGRIKALRDIDLQVPQGVIYGLLGPNGAGKTTMIKALVGALRPTSGTIRVLGLEPIQDRWSLRKQIGYMPQSPALYEDLSARDNILFFGKAQNTPELEKKTDEIISFTELTDRENDRVHT